MNTSIITKNGVNIAVIQSETPLLTDAQSALDLIGSMNYLHECTRIALPKSAVCEEFFKLSSGVAGEILQKFINYSAKLAIFGDFSRYTSKPLRDFIYESNNGRDIFFVETEDDAAERLSR
jgi:hypothetical protein